MLTFKEDELSQLTLHTFSAGHTNTERGYLQVLASKLENIPADLLAELTLEEKEALSQMEVRVSEEDKHPLVFA
jgi:putative NIF3 family GTP cyclohydrolase 1 type 2